MAVVLRGGEIKVAEGTVPEPPAPRQPVAPAEPSGEWTTLDQLLTGRPMQHDAIRRAGRELISPKHLGWVEDAAKVRALAFQLRHRNAEAPFREGILDGLWHAVTNGYGEVDPRIPSRLGLAGGQGGSPAAAGWRALFGDVLYEAIVDLFGTVARLARHRSLHVAPTGSCVVAPQVWKALHRLSELIVERPALAKQMARVFVESKSERGLQAMTCCGTMYIIKRGE